MNVDFFLIEYGKKREIYIFILLKLHDAQHEVNVILPLCESAPSTSFKT